MSDKPIAVLMTALVVAPICVTCLVGPAVLGSMIVGLWGWFSGNAPLAAVAVVVMAASLVYALKRRQRRQPDASAGSREDAARRNVEGPGGMSHE